jgi:hypothetical protein
MEAERPQRGRGCLHPALGRAQVSPMMVNRAEHLLAGVDAVIDLIARSQLIAPWSD